MRYILVPLLFLTSISFGFDSTVKEIELIQNSLTDENLREKKDGDELMKIYKHKLSYLISGKPDTKLQLSFKFRILENIDLFGAYTQLMFWDIGTRESSPFSDLNYNPELFYRVYKKYGILRGVDIGLYEHRSNGRDRIYSRSWDRTYLNILTEFDSLETHFRWSTKFFYLYNIDNTNSDIPHTLGFVESELAILDILPSILTDAEIYFRFLPGGKFNVEDSRGAQEFGARFRLPWTSFNPYLYFQIYNGFSESQLFYDQNRTTYRIGFSI